MEKNKAKKAEDISGKKDNVEKKGTNEYVIASKSEDKDNIKNKYDKYSKKLDATGKLETLESDKHKKVVSSKNSDKDNSSGDNVYNIYKGDVSIEISENNFNRNMSYEKPRNHDMKIFMIGCALLIAAFLLGIVYTPGVEVTADVINNKAIKPFDYDILNGNYKISYYFDGKAYHDVYYAEPGKHKDVTETFMVRINPNSPQKVYMNKRYAIYLCVLGVLGLIIGFIDYLIKERKNR